MRVTGSAITSRSRRNSTRGPPSAPRIGVILGAGWNRAAPALLSQEIAPAGPVTRGHISPQAIANAPCKPQAKGRGREARKVSRVRHNPVALLSLPIRRDCAVRRMLALGISGGGGNRRGRAAHLRFWAAWPVPKRPLRALKKSAPSPIPARARNSLGLAAAIQLALHAGAPAAAVV